MVDGCQLLDMVIKLEYLNLNCLIWSRMSLWCDVKACKKTPMSIFESEMSEVVILQGHKHY